MHLGRRDGKLGLSRLRQERAAGATTDIKSLTFNFAWWMKKEGYADSTIEGRVKLLKTMLRRGAKILDPETVKEFTSRQDTWSAGRKELAVQAYSAFLKMRRKSQAFRRRRQKTEKKNSGETQQPQDKQDLVQDFQAL